MSIYATGAGVTASASADGLLATAAYALPANVLVTVTMGRLPCVVSYAGAAPYLVSGAAQINAQAPAGVTAGANVPLAVTIGDVSAQTGVTLAVQ